MSVLEANQVDGAAFDTASGRVVLLIADHLDWEDEAGHLNKLQDKINAYLAFVQNGEIDNLYPEQVIRGVRFDFRFKFPLSEKGKRFLEVVQQTVQPLNIELSVEAPQ
ncbi:hypothetical protein B9G55_18015 [Saccharibacillus sp. O16]|nr:hypothetical protein B9G55_18015 [Saccharibacillus sp. O16]